MLINRLWILKTRYPTLGDRTRTQLLEDSEATDFEQDSEQQRFRRLHELPCRRLCATEDSLRSFPLAFFPVFWELLV